MTLTLDAHSTLLTHLVENSSQSALKAVGIMRKLKYEFGRLALNQIYISYVRHIFEYSSIVWDGCSEQNADLLEKLEHEAARITGLTRSVSLENLYKECGWPSLAIRRKYKKLNFMFKAFNMVPEYIARPVTVA